MNIILANGSFPRQPQLLQMLQEAEHVCCCDGAALTLLAFGRIPDAVVGDLDSIGQIPEQLKERVVMVTEQETNDLAKAFRFCLARGWTEQLTILGATGKREDHTLGNISLLADFALQLPQVEMITDDGVFFPMLQSGSFASQPGEQISIFSLDPETPISSRGLKWELKNLMPVRWWQATLNQAVDTQVELLFPHGKTLIIYKARCGRTA